MEGTILIVDDDAEFVSRLCDCFRGAGYGVLCAGTAEDAIAQVERHHSEIDLIVLDLALADQNGFEILAMLRRRPSRIKILCTTAVYTDDFLYITTRLGADAAIRKPEAETFASRWLEAATRVMSQNAGGAGEA